MKVRISFGSSVEEIEISILTKFCEETIGRMDIEQLCELSTKIGIKSQNYSKQVVAAAILITLRKSGVKVLAPIVSFIGSNIVRILVGRGVYIATAGVLGRAAVVLAGPLGWAITTGWLAFDLASPAYRVTVPAVLQIACMRLNYHSHFLPARCV